MLFNFIRRKHNLAHFFENSESLPIFNPEAKVPYGRSWRADELRVKSFEDLHKLWFVLIKELNLLFTQKHEARRLGQRWFGHHRIAKVLLYINFSAELVWRELKASCLKDSAFMSDV